MTHSADNLTGAIPAPTIASDARAREQGRERDAERGRARFAGDSCDVGALRKIPHGAEAADKKNAVKGGAAEGGEGRGGLGQLSC